MGGETFRVTAKGKTAAEAFQAARAEAQYEHGHSGYSGTIAEKDSFTMIPFDGKAPNGGSETAAELARRLIEAGDRRIDDKWGPAGCIALGGDTWLFFGWASS